MSSSGLWLQNLQNLTERPSESQMKAQAAPWGGRHFYC